MDLRTIKYEAAVVRRAYKQIFRDPIFCLTNVVLLVLFAMSVFLLLVYEPYSHWQETSFVLSGTNYRYSRGGAVLDLYTEDGRSFALNRDEGEIRYQLDIGKKYRAVYSDDLSGFIIRSMSDHETEYLNLEESIRVYKRDTMLWIATAVASLFFVALFNVLFVRAILLKERKRMRNFQKNNKWG